MDDFSRAKHHLALSLGDLRTDVDRLHDRRQQLGAGERDLDSIRLSHSIHEKLVAAGAEFNMLKTMQTKSEQSKHKSSLSPALLADRRDMLRLVGLEMLGLTQAASASNAHANESKEDQEMFERVAAHRQAKEQARLAAREARRNRGRHPIAEAAAGRGRGRQLSPDEFVIDIPELVEVDLGAQSQSAQEVAFHDQVDLNRQTQDRLLDEILRGLTDLEQLAQQAEVQLGVQAVALDQVDGALDKNISSLKTANRQLKSILKSSGGMTRWIPVLVCVVLLLALLGFMFGVLK